MIEIVARAMTKRAAADAFGYTNDNSSPDEGWEYYVPLARAAISALAANVSDEMVRAGEEALTGTLVPVESELKAFLVAAIRAGVRE